MSLLKNPKYAFGLLQTPSDAEIGRPSRTCVSGNSSSNNPCTSKGSSHRSSSMSNLCTPVARSKTPNRRQVSSSSFNVQYPGSSSSVQSRTPKRAGTSTTPHTASSTVSGGNNSTTIVAVVEGRGQARGEIGITSLDLKQPVLTLSQFSDNHTYTKTISMLHSCNPLEIVLPHTLCEVSTTNKLYSLLDSSFPEITKTSVQRRYFNEGKGLQYVRQLCSEDYKSIELQVSSKYYCLATTAALLKYVEFIQNIMYAPNSLQFVFKASEKSTMIDSSTVKNLEVLQNLKDPTSEASLYGILHHTKTASGSRLLRSNLLQPPNDEGTIQGRQEAVTEMTEKEDIFYNLQSAVSKFLDIGHVVSVCVQLPKQETPRTVETKLMAVIMLKHILQLVGPLHEYLSHCENQIFKTYCQILNDPRYEIILSKIAEVIREGTHYEKGLLQQRTQKLYAVKDSINGMLDVARRTYSEVVGDAENIIMQYAENYNLPLRMTYSSQQGYHIQMPAVGARGADNLPSLFIKVSKFKNSLSFTSMDLIHLNDRMKAAVDDIFSQQNIIMTELLTSLHPYIGCLYQLSDLVAMVDMLLSFAHAATLSAYVCPEFTDTLAVKQGFHPILQKTGLQSVVPNDTYASEHCNFVVITGPNMGGKSTYLRQVALLQIMAQIGSFVPAQYASFRITDQIFSRISSEDDMESNSSTFTLEMKETSYILQNVSDNSLIIIDELGKGTSAEEGVGICWAIAEELQKTKAYTFFATHFLQLTDMTRNYPNVVNYYFEVQQVYSKEADQEKVSYTHILSPGVTPATHYGLQLAEMSTLPQSVILEARQVAALVEKKRLRTQKQNTELIKQHATFTLATKLIQVAKNSRMDEDSLRVYLKMLKRNYQTEMAKAENPSDSSVSNSDKT